MNASRWLLLVLGISGLLSSLAVPASAQQDPADTPTSSAAAPLVGSGPPVLADGFMLGGRWLAPGVVSLDWDDMAGAAGYELMVRAGDGWVLLSEHEATEGVLVAFDGSAALVAGLARDVAEHWFAVRARNASGVSLWSHSTAVEVPENEVEDGDEGRVFDPFTAPTRSGIDLERLREAIATVTPGGADCSAAPALDVAGVAVVEPPTGLNDPETPLTVAEVTRIAGGCLVVEYVALAGRSVAQVRALLASEPSVQTVGAPPRGVTLEHDSAGIDDDTAHHDDGGGRQWHLTPDIVGLWPGWQASNPVTVAVLDTGVDARHPDFDGQVVSGGLMACHSADPDGHGTHVAGIIAARQRQRGASGGHRRRRARSEDPADTGAGTCGLPGGHDADGRGG